MVSRPISLCLTRQRPGGNTYSMGSSSTTMTPERVREISSIMAAMVVDFPDPVAPVMRIRPSSNWQKFLTTGGRPRASKEGFRRLMKRKAASTVPRA